MKTQSKKHKIIRTVLLVILLLLIVAAGGFISVYEGRFHLAEYFHAECWNRP